MAVASIELGSLMREVKRSALRGFTRGSTGVPVLEEFFSQFRIMLTWLRPPIQTSNLQ